MRYFKGSLWSLLAIFLLAACGSSGTSSSGTTGTVVVKGGTAASSAFVLETGLDATVTTGTVDNVYVLTYAICFAQSADCASMADSDWVCAFDNTGSASATACTTSLGLADTTASDFYDITASPTLATNGSFAAGTYSCVKITMCDQLVWTTSDSDISECPSSSTLDVSGPDDEAGPETLTFYWSTSGTAGDEAETGTAAKPMLLTSSFTVTAGDTTTVTFNMSNKTGGGWEARYNDGTDPTEGSDGCDVPSPSLSLE